MESELGNSEVGELEVVESEVVNSEETENQSLETQVEKSQQEESFEPSQIELTEQEECGLIEALLFSCGESMSLDVLSQFSGLKTERIIECIQAISHRLNSDEAGVEIVCVAEKYQLRTKSLFGPYIRQLKTGGPRKLTAAALETLSIVAYRQPIVKSDIEKIRGVDATPTIKTLLDRKLINIIGHQATVGQPALYGTTEEFLELFGLTSLGQLPSLRDLNELETDPGEVSETQDDITVDERPAEETSPAIS